MKKLIIGILLFGSVLNAQTYQKANIFIEDSMKLGTSTNSVWIDTIKAGSIIISYNGADYTMDGVPIGDTIVYSPNIFYVNIDSVASGSSDLNSGTHPDTAWATIAKVNAASFNAGDSIRFRAGKDWREQLTMGSHGAVDDHVVYTSYGEGDLPRMLSSEQTDSWADLGSNIWIHVDAAIDSFPLGRLFIEVTDKDDVRWGILETEGIGELDTLDEYVYSNDTIYLYALADPGAEYSSVEYPQRSYCVLLNNINYVTLNRLDLRYSYQAGVKELHPFTSEIGLTIAYNDISYHGYKGTTVGFGIEAYHSDLWIHHNVVHDAGRRGISIHLQDGGAPHDTLEDIIVEYNTVYDCYHSGISTVSDIDLALMKDVFVRYNLVYTDTSQPNDFHMGHYHVYGIEDGAVNTLENINYYNNISRNASNMAFELRHAENTNFYFNTIYGCNQHSDAFTGQIFMAGSIDNSCNIKNNIFYNNNVFSRNNFWPCIYATSALGLDIDSNHYYNVDHLNNMYFNITGASGNPYYYNEYANYKTQTGWDAASNTLVDPLFSDTDSLSLQAASHAIDSASNVQAITDDYYNQPRSDPKDMGAVERQGTWIAFVLSTLVFINRRNRKRLQM